MEAGAAEEASSGTASTGPFHFWPQIERSDLFREMRDDFRFSPPHYKTPVVWWIIGNKSSKSVDYQGREKFTLP